jgi:predicted Rossmann fold flavoprotein
MADVVVLGAGAAGLFCAAIAGQRGKTVIVLDHAARPGGKILISGGGKCNFTNLRVSPENFISANPHFCKSALAGFTPGAFIAIVEAAGIPYHEKRLGQLFCDNSARDILTMLLGMCGRGGVDIRCDTHISGVTKSDCFVVETSAGPVQAGALVVATGGLSIPKLGATGFAYELARQFGLALIPMRPGLVPLVFSGGDLAWMQELSGVSFDAQITAGKTRFREQALFTHRGLSGPAVLQISSYLETNAALGVNLLPELDAQSVLRARKASRGKAALKTVLAEFLPARLAQGFLPAEIGSAVIGDLSHKALDEVAARLNALTLLPVGTEGFAKAEVTVGGVDTAGLSSKTMAATAVPGLFVIGEAVDVTGWLGGYNFQWAWASGYAAGMAV